MQYGQAINLGVYPGQYPTHASTSDQQHNLGSGWASHQQQQQQQQQQQSQLQGWNNQQQGPWLDHQASQLQWGQQPDYGAQHGVHGVNTFGHPQAPAYHLGQAAFYPQQTVTGLYAAPGYGTVQAVQAPTGEQRAYSDDVAGDGSLRAVRHLPACFHSLYSTFR